jgi:5'(3')-deoxyribonucleotidase/nicotinic acid mononucleotide adenylyltransferase
MRATQLNTAVFAFGRFNPPTIGHGRLIEVVKMQQGVPFLFLTHTQKPKTDPLTFQQKVKYAKASFTNIKIGDSSVRTLIQALQKLESLGFLNIIMVVGDDRLKQFSDFLPKYNGKDYNFESVKVISAGERDPDSEGAVGMSASKMKAMAVAGDFKGFKKGAVNHDMAKDMYNDVRAGMGITEIKESQSSSTPNVYVDMDGVLADFFTALAKFRGVDHWKDGGQEDVQDSITAIQGTNFFSTLPVFDTASQVINSVKAFTGGEWYINSSPLRGDHENSTKHKLEWIKKNNFDPADVIITGRKESYAINKQTNQPNILIDDKPSNLERWKNKGGIGIRYQATQDNPLRVQKGLDVIKSYLEKNNGMIDPKDVSELNKAVDTGQIMENGGRVVPGVNTTHDVGPNEIRIQAKKMGFSVSKDGVPPILKPKNLREYLEVIEDRDTRELKFQNKDGKYSMLSLPGTQKWQKDKKTAEPGTDKWFKTFKTLPYLTKGRKNHYMLPIKEKISELENLLKEYGVIKKDK